ncbi:hypothetical protein [Nonomuraea zeae]|uniref:Divalent-cation tolerance protein CutA n=1 Tax=Nonomuraea zeae TaxID=1642303 RepID=A0A5S4H164_9ACTN|nr:hypothetical protein [Nonomuraea zeae]TMR38434.1 hypothetical protein ETD85_04840 [Nonomuraea zeae]
MTEFIEVRTTIEGHEKAAELAHGILRSGLATSIDLTEVAQPAAPHDRTTWQLTLITTEQQAPALELHIRDVDRHAPISRQPVSEDIDAYPDWLINDQP